MNQATLRRAAIAANKLSEWLVLLTLLAACVPQAAIRRDSLSLIPKLSSVPLIDFSWALDTSYKAAGGIWFGRDVAFTYGPAFQWLSSAPARWMGLSTGSILGTWYTLPLILATVATFLTARLLLPHVPAWRRALLLLLAVVFWSPPDVRVSVCLLAFAVFVRLTDSMGETRAELVLRALACAAICVACFWLSADTGLYTTAALLLCIAATAVTKHRFQGMGLFALLAAGFFAVFVLLTNALLTTVFDFGFWRSSLAIASGYRWFEASGMSKADKYRVLATLAAGVVAFCLGWRQRRRNASLTRVFLLAGFTLGFLMLQSAVVRSDHGHVLIGLYGMIFLCGTIALGNFESRLLSIALPAMTIIGTLWLASPYPAFRPPELMGRWRQIMHPLVACPAGSVPFDDACFQQSDADLLANVSAYVDARTAPGDKIAIFPYQNAFGLASRRQVAGGVLQSYLVNGEYLTGLALAGLRRSQPPLALYFPDGMLSMPIDGVPNFTRSPELWFYLLRHYRADASPSSGVLGLTRDDGRDLRLRLTAEKLASPIRPLPINQRSTTIDLGTLTWPAAGADLLKLRVRVDYPFWWRLRKPSKLSLLLVFSDGTQKPAQFVAPPDQSRDVWVYLWGDKEMGAYFSDDPGLWRANHAALTGVKLLITPFDWLSVVPDSVTVESIEAVRLDLTPQ